MPQCTLLRDSLIAQGRTKYSRVYTPPDELEVVFEVQTEQVGNTPSNVRLSLLDASGEIARPIQTFYQEGTDYTQSSQVRLNHPISFAADGISGMCRLTLTITDRPLPVSPPNVDLSSESLLYVNPLTQSLDTLPTPENATTRQYFGLDSSGQSLGFHPFPPSSVSGHVHIDNVVPSGAVDGSNRVFTLSPVPDPPSSLKLFLGGLLMTQGEDYQISGSQIEYDVGATPQMGLNHRAFYTIQV